MIEYRTSVTIGGEKIEYPVKQRSRDWVKSFEVRNSMSGDGYEIVIVFDDGSSRVEPATHEQLDYWKWRVDWQNEKMGLK